MPTAVFIKLGSSMVRGSVRNLEEKTWLLSLAFAYKYPFALVYSVQIEELRSRTCTSRSICCTLFMTVKKMMLNLACNKGKAIRVSKIAALCQVEKNIAMF